jgi:hypothetical protein
MKLRLSVRRYSALEYLLRMAGLSSTKAQKVGWRSLAALFVFVEHEQRFPRQGELYSYLHSVLDESKSLEQLDLPPISIETVTQSLEASRLEISKDQQELASLRERVSQTLESIQKLQKDLPKRTEPGFLFESKPILDINKVQERLVQIEKLLTV